MRYTPAVFAGALATASAITAAVWLWLMPDQPAWLDRILDRLADLVRVQTIGVDQ